MKLFVSLLIAGVLLVNTGCDDPSPLSVDLVDTSSGAPEVVEISVGTLSAYVAPDITGNARRSLVGRVDDPAVGVISASAGLDFASPVVRSSAFQEGPITEAVLRLAPTYRYGDTTSTVQVAVRSIDDDWISSGGDSRDQIPFGAIITSGEIAGADTLTSIPLPASWIDANSALIRSTDFLNGFQGFYLEATDGDAVVGLSSVGSVLRIVSGPASGPDTVNFVVSRNLTRISRESSATPPAGTVILQDGIGDGIEIAFDDAVDQLESTALNRAVLRIPIDTLSAALPPNFVRPRPSQLDFAGVTEDSVVVTLAISVEENGELRFSSASMTSVIQDILLGQSPFPRYVIKGHLDVAPVDNTIDVLVIPDGSIGNAFPKMVFTVVKP